MDKRWVALAGLCAVLAGAGLDYASPRLTLWRIERASSRGDLRTVASYVDFPALRQNLKTGLRRRPDVAGDTRRIAATDGLVDLIVTPEGMAGIGVLVSGPSNGPSRASASDRSASHRIAVFRTAWGEFEARPDSARDFALVFRRSGLGWKLTDARLPADFKIPLLDRVPEADVQVGTRRGRGRRVLRPRLRP